MKRNIAFLSVVAAGLLGQANHANAAGLNSSQTDYVYVETNIMTPSGNSIAAFSRGSNGQLQPIPGSPFLTGGAGTQYTGVAVGPEDSDQDIISNPEHTLLFAVNSGSDSIAVFHIQPNGSLVPVEGSPFPSGGNDPVSLDLVGSILFVVNKSGDFGRPSAILPNYTTLQVRSNGTLTPTPESTNDTAHGYQSTVSVAVGASPSQAHVVPHTDLLFGTDFLGGLIQRFQFDGSGGLHQLSPLALPASEFTDTTTGRTPLNLWHHPSLPLIYVGMVTANMLGVYEYNEEGRLTFIRTVRNSGQAICWIRTNLEGTRLYTTDTVTNSVSVYNLNNPEEPQQIQEFALSGVGNVLQFSLSSDEKSLYALSSRGSTSIPEGQGNVLHVLTIQQDGTVAETVSPVVFQLPNDTRPQGVAVVPANE
jgi:6-phosphogluconolactonase (cycloisomerase 2 family)